MSEWAKRMLLMMLSGLVVWAIGIMNRGGVHVLGNAALGIRFPETLRGDKDQLFVLCLDATYQPKANVVISVPTTSGIRKCTTSIGGTAQLGARTEVTGPIVIDGEFLDTNGCDLMILRR